MGFFIDLKEDDIKQRQRAFQNKALSSGLNFLTLTSLFAIMLSSTIFFLHDSHNSNVFAREDAKNIQSAAVSNAPVFLNEQTSDDNAIPVKVVLYKDPFENIELKAQSVYVLDVTTGRVLYERNKNTPKPLASLAKIMTAIIATELAENNDIVTIKEEDIISEGNSGLFIGEKWRLDDILDFTLLTSSNDGASAIASAMGAFVSRSTTTLPLSDKELFIEKMNDRVKELGCVNMQFYNESGLDINEMQSGAYGTAREIAKLFEHILLKNPYLLRATTNETMDIDSESNISHTAKNTNEFVRSFPGLMASKTGYTELAGGNLGIVFDSGIGTPIIIIVLGSTFDGRFEDVIKLYEASLKEVGQNL